MKDEYWIYGGLALFYIGKLLYQYYQRSLHNKTISEIADSRYKRYLELRGETFLLKPRDVGITVPDDETAFALMLEMHLFDVLLSVVAFSDGKAWTFNTQSARKSIDDDNTESLRLAAVEAVKTAQYHFARMRRRRGDVDKLLPGHIKFHILTNQDIYSADDTIEATLNESSQWTEIIKKAFTVVDEFDNIAKSKSLKRIAHPKTTIKRRQPANF
jgi:hypothetical protein